MDENDFKRLLEESAAETRRRLGERFDQVDARFAQVDKRFEQIDERFANTNARFDQVDARAAETNARLQNVEVLTADTNVRVEKVEARTADTNARLEKVEARTSDLKDHIDNIVAQIKQDFGTTAEDMRTDVQRVAESVLMVNAKLDREAADIRAEMRQGFAETQAMLRFSHGRLDDRVTALERAAK